jgi:hypothetical protein
MAKFVRNGKAYIKCPYSVSLIKLILSNMTNTSVCFTVKFILVKAYENVDHAIATSNVTSRINWGDPRWWLQGGSRK